MNIRVSACTLMQSVFWPFDVEGAIDKEVYRDDP